MEFLTGDSGEIYQIFKRKNKCLESAFRLEASLRKSFFKSLVTWLNLKNVR